MEVYNARDGDKDMVEVAERVSDKQSLAWSESTEGDKEGGCA